MPAGRPDRGQLFRFDRPLHLELHRRLGRPERGRPGHAPGRRQQQREPPVPDPGSGGCPLHGGDRFPGRHLIDPERQQCLALHEERKVEAPAPNADQDGDSVRDEDDNCTSVSNPRQDNIDGDKQGDACDDDDDDGDGVNDSGDNCKTIRNATQGDRDEDDIGDACDPLRGKTRTMTARPTTVTTASARQTRASGPGRGRHRRCLRQDRWSRRRYDVREETRCPPAAADPGRPAIPDRIRERSTRTVTARSAGWTTSSSSSARR